MKFFSRSFDIASIFTWALSESSHIYCRIFLVLSVTHRLHFSVHLVILICIFWRIDLHDFVGLFSCSYTKPKGQLPDYEAPVVLKNGQSTVEDFCMNLHKSILKEFK